MLQNTHLRSCPSASDGQHPQIHRPLGYGAIDADPSEILDLPIAGTRESRPGLGEVWIETERLALRIPRGEEFPAYFQMLSDPDAFRFSTRQPIGPEEAWIRLLWNIGHWSMLGYGLFAVVEKASGRLVGEVGMGAFRRLLGVRFDSCPEARWMIAGWAQGQGYATEAAAAALEWMEDRSSAGRTVCLVDSEDSESLRLARKLGYIPFAMRAYQGYICVLHERCAGRDFAAASGSRKGVLLFS